MNTILFDLDGTLLPLNTELFMKIYFEEMAIAFEDLIDKDKLVEAIWAATGVMVKNIEKKKNEAVFMETFESLITGDIDVFKERFDAFYDNGFLKVRGSVMENKWIKKSVELLKEKGYQLVLATNPLFPKKAILTRLEWTGLHPEDFIYMTSYEDNHYCKPNLHFYEEILERIGKDASSCMMVGNDVQEDLVAGQLGMKTYLITEHMLNRNNGTIVCDEQGGYEDFYHFVEGLPKIE